VKRGIEAKAIQLACSLVIPIQTARPVGVTVTMAFQMSACHLTNFNKEEEERRQRHSGLPAIL